MAKSRVVTVATIPQQRVATLQATKDTLRALKSVGVKFSTEEVDGGPTVVKAWIETPEPRANAASAPAATPTSGSTEA
jgi:hypothetical protein